MIKHIVLLNWKEGTTQDQIDKISNGFELLKEQIPEIKNYQFGPDAGIYKGNAHYSLIAEFENEEAFKRYVVNKKHQAFLNDVAGPILESFQSTQFVF